MSGATAVDRVARIMDALKDCLCAELEARGFPVCSCTVLRGVQALPDSCGCNGGGCGRAWVRLDRLYPASVQFPAQNNVADNCASELAAVIEVGVLRCVPTLKAGGAAPNDVEQTNAALEAVSDASAMYAALTCCPELQHRVKTLGVYLPRDAGDCGGGAWSITVALQPERQRTSRRTVS